MGIATIAVGVISSYDDVNSLLLAGRADLCALARAHLYDPNWTLHAAADQGYADPAQSGRTHSRRAAASRKGDAATVPNPGSSSSATARPAPATAAGDRHDAGSEG